jgi:hypothetical protein
MGLSERFIDEVGKCVHDACSCDVCACGVVAAQPFLLARPAGRRLRRVMPARTSRSTLGDSSGRALLTD